MTIGKVVKEYRDSHGISQQDFADRSEGKLTRFVISKAENSPTYRPHPETLKALADVMNMTVDDLLNQAFSGSNH